MITEAKIISTIRKTVQEMYEAGHEEWVDGKTLCAQLPMFSKDWLSRHGDMLPRERMTYAEDGKIRQTRFMYPITKIKRMVTEGCFR